MSRTNFNWCWISTVRCYVARLTGARYLMSGANFNWCWISTVRCKVYNIHTTSGAGVKLFSLVSKNSSNNGYFTTLVVVVVVVTPPHSTNQHHHSTGIPPSQTAIKITTTARLSPIKNRLSRNQLCRYLRCFVAKSVVTQFTRFWCQMFELEMVLVLKKLQISGMHCHMFRIVPCEECQVDVLQKDKVSWPGEVEKKSARWPNFCPTIVLKLSIWYWIFWPPITTIAMQSINGFQRHSPFNARKGNYLFFNLFGVWKQLFFYGCPQLIWQYNGNFPFLKYNT